MKNEGLGKDKSPFIKIYDALETAKRDGSALLELSDVTIELIRIDDEA